jgi:hypothetical protein
VVKVADTIDEAVKLMEVGYEYHAEVEGQKMFRKRNVKYWIIPKPHSKLKGL